MINLSKIKNFNDISSLRGLTWKIPQNDFLEIFSDKETTIMEIGKRVCITFFDETIFDEPILVVADFCDGLLSAINIALCRTTALENKEMLKIYEQIKQEFLEKFGDGSQIDKYKKFGFLSSGWLLESSVISLMIFMHGCNTRKIPFPLRSSRDKKPAVRISLGSRDYDPFANRWMSTDNKNDTEALWFKKLIRDYKSFLWIFFIGIVFGISESFLIPNIPDSILIIFSILFSLGWLFYTVKVVIGTFKVFKIIKPSILQIGISIFLFWLFFLSPLVMVLYVIHLMNKYKQINKINSGDFR
ncbi:hypothetical protein KAW65_05955 [candidate division WOR-3 bacterium]|nr:hypothetical protein [candidate division WOR-3 bacterium]